MRFRFFFLIKFLIAHLKLSQMELRFKIISDCFVKQNGFSSLLFVKNPLLHYEYFGKKIVRKFWGVEMEASNKSNPCKIFAVKLQILHYLKNMYVYFLLSIQLIIFSAYFGITIIYPLLQWVLKHEFSVSVSGYF